MNEVELENLLQAERQGQQGHNSQESIQESFSTSGTPSVGDPDESEDYEASLNEGNHIPPAANTESPILPVSAHAGTPEIPVLAIPQDGIQRPKHTRRTLIHELQRDWKWETRICILMLCFLGTIIGTLFRFQNKPQPQWPSLISVNALVSAEAVAFKAALVHVVSATIGQSQWSYFRQKRSLHDIELYNEASRGTWGSFTWVFQRFQPLTTFGAIIVLLAVATDPFVQQLLQYTNCTVEMAHMSATLPRTNVFIHNTVMTGFSQAPNGAEVRALQQGILSRASDVGVNCPSGNCTFTAEYSTLGYCGSCEDITKQVSTEPIANTSNSAYTTSLPSGLSITVNVSSRYQDVFKMGQQMEPLFETEPIELIAIGSSNNLVAAASCKFAHCIRSYRADVTNGQLNETLIDHSDPAVPWSTGNANFPDGADNSSYSMLDTSCLSPSQIQGLRDLHYQLDLNSRYLPLNLNFSSTLHINEVTPSSRIPDSLFAGSCLYALSVGDENTWRDESLFSDNVLTGNLTALREHGDGVPSTYNGSTIAQYIYNDTNVNFDSINAVFQNLATSYTNYVRQNGLEHHSVPAQGTVHHYAICIQIQWQWIALPALLALLAIILLVVTILQTHRE